MPGHPHKVSYFEYRLCHKNFTGESTYIQLECLCSVFEHPYNVSKQKKHVTTHPDLSDHMKICLIGCHKLTNFGNLMFWWHNLGLFLPAIYSDIFCGLHLTFCKNLDPDQTQHFVRPHLDL